MMFSFLNPYMLWIKLGGIALALAASFGAGMRLEGTIKDKTLLTMQRDQVKAAAISQALALKQQAAADKITHDTDVANAESHQKIVTVTQHIIQKVPTYVTPEIDKRFPMPCGFIRLHDAAASGVEPEKISLPTGLSDPDICPVTASAASAIIAGNYALALGWRADLISWEHWYADQAAEWDKNERQ